MSFESVIPKLLEDFCQAWNDADMSAFSEMLDEDIILTTPGLVFTNVSIKPQVLKGKEEVMNFLTRSRTKLPLRSKISGPDEQVSKRVIFKVHYYEIDVWSLFDCVISSYGRFKELKITRLENTEGKKISTIIVLKNILKYRLKNLFRQ